jgi:hypothetical protein
MATALVTVAASSMGDRPAAQGQIAFPVGYMPRCPMLPCAAAGRGRSAMRHCWIVPGMRPPRLEACALSRSPRHIVPTRCVGAQRTQKPDLPRVTLYVCMPRAVLSSGTISLFPNVPTPESGPTVLVEFKVR